MKLGLIALLCHGLRLLLQQSIGVLFRLPGLLLFLLLLPGCFPFLALALCNLGFQLLLPGQLQLFTLLLGSLS